VVSCGNNHVGNYSLSAASRLMLYSFQAKFRIEAYSYTRKYILNH